MGDVANMLMLGAAASSKADLTKTQQALRSVLKPTASFELPKPKTKATAPGLCLCMWPFQTMRVLQ